MSEYVRSRSQRIPGPKGGFAPRAADVITREAGKSQKYMNNSKRPDNYVYECHVSDYADKDLATNPHEAQRRIELASGLVEDLPPRGHEKYLPPPTSYAVQAKHITRMRYQNEPAANIMRTYSDDRIIEMPASEAGIPKARRYNERGEFICPFGDSENGRLLQEHRVNPSKTCLVFTKTLRPKRSADYMHMLTIPLEHLPGADLLNPYLHVADVLEMKRWAIYVLSEWLHFHKEPINYEFYINCHLFPFRSEHHLHWHTLLFKLEQPVPQEELCSPVYDYGNGKDFRRGNRSILKELFKSQLVPNNKIEIVMRPNGLVLSIDAVLSIWRASMKFGYALRKYRLMSEHMRNESGGPPQYELVLVKWPWNWVEDREMYPHLGQTATELTLEKKGNRHSRRSRSRSCSPSRSNSAHSRKEQEAWEEVPEETRPYFPDGLEDIPECFWGAVRYLD